MPSSASPSCGTRVFLYDRTVTIFYEDLKVIDEDLGVSGSGADPRSGYARLTADVALARVGIVFGLVPSSEPPSRSLCRTGVGETRAIRTGFPRCVCWEASIGCWATAEVSLTWEQVWWTFPLLI